MTMATVNGQTLTERQKGLAACACLMAQGDLERLEPAVKTALDNGVTINELKEAFSQLYAYTGFPRSLNALGVLQKVLENKQEKWQEGYTLSTVWPKGNPNTAFAQYFIGNSYLAVLDNKTGLCNVTFEPGCRNNWHVHHGAVQMLICVAGRGWYQEWGKEPVELKPGVTIAVPEGVKHWHGAAADSWMQHLTYHANVQPGNSNEWLEPVTDEVYGKLK